MDQTVFIELAPPGVRLEIERGAALAEALAAYGVEFPCGGSELCGGCRVRVLEGALAPCAGDLCVFTDEEIAAGWRLACRAHAEGPLKLEVGQWAAPVLADSARLGGSRREGAGIAVDLGTTTLAAQLLDLASGEVLGLRTGLNPQCARGADVMTRVSFALRDDTLTRMIRDAVGDMVAQLAEDSTGVRVREVVIAGNTVMHHLFCGIDVEPLSHVPFEFRDGGERIFTPQELGWPLPATARIRFLPCVGGFVGSDILAGIAAAGIARSTRLAALIDLGTNGEIVLGNSERILCASTAAGPAFEAGTIRMGMRAAAGAVSHVFVRGGNLEAHVIGNTAPRGLCGSGLVDAVAAGLDTGAILPNGRMANGARQFTVAGPVALVQSDVRELQLAKAAIASGLRLLAARWGAELDDIAVVHLAGAFGNYVRIESAVRIGLLEIPPCRIETAGNTALRGAKMMLLSPELRIEAPVEHISLASEPGFQDAFVNAMPFPALM
jgi:uncharacterized 2Fe-2S/4Fe-4S cluster protein (DUF4445 family)